MIAPSPTPRYDGNLTNVSNTMTMSPFNGVNPVRKGMKTCLQHQLHKRSNARSAIHCRSTRLSQVAGSSDGYHPHNWSHTRVGSYLVCFSWTSDQSLGSGVPNYCCQWPLIYILQGDQPVTNVHVVLSKSESAWDRVKATLCVDRLCVLHGSNLFGERRSEENKKHVRPKPEPNSAVDGNYLA